jgi:hypothetical protein
LNFISVLWFVSRNSSWFAHWMEFIMFIMLSQLFDLMLPHVIYLYNQKE